MEHAAYTDATKSLLDYDSQASTPESEIDEEKALLGHWTKPAHNDRHIDAAIARPLASRPQYTIIIPPPSREMMRKRERDLLNFDIEMNRLIEEDEDDGYQSPSEPVRQYEVVVEDERGIHTVERRPLKSDWDSVDAKASKSGHPTSKARLEHLYGRLPLTGAAPLLLANENEGRRQFTNDDIQDRKSDTGSPNQLSSFLGENNLAKDSSGWLDEWKKGKAEVQERLKFLYETGNRRTSYCKRIL